ncbi:hypothetical protein J7L01_07300, partial [bacterium]|nr:hypothetical protein [bacterium]
MGTGTINKILLVILAFTVCTFSVEAGDVLKYNIVDNGSALSIGTVVKIVSDTTIDVCGEEELPVGVIIGYEGASSDPDYYLVANSGIASDVLCGEAISDGDKLVPCLFGSVQKLSSDIDGYVVGVALEDGSLGNRIKMMVDIVTGGGAGGGGADDDWQILSDGTPPDTVYNLSDYIGIGTSTPAEKLDVNGNLYLSGGDLRTDRWTGGATNTYIGMNVAYLNAFTAGATFNTFIGATAGAYGTSGNRNTFVGRQCGFANTEGNQNTFIGNSAGEANVDGDYNAIVGSEAGDYTRNSDNNSFFGAYSAHYNGGDDCTGSCDDNSIFGAFAGYGVASGGIYSCYEKNSLFGAFSGYALTEGDSNTFIGYQSGKSVTTGHDNILIGCDVDTPSPTTNNYLNIGNLIYGDLANGFVGIGVDSPEVALHIEGSARLNTIAEPASPDFGEIYSSGAKLYYYDGGSWLDLTAGATGGLWTASTDYIAYTDNSNARVYKSTSGKPYFYASSNDSDAAWFECSRTGTGLAAGVHGVASSNVNNKGVIGEYTGGQWGYLGGDEYGAFGKFESSPRWSKGVLGAADTAVIGFAYPHTSVGYGAYFEAQPDGSSTEPIYGVYAKGNSNANNTSYGVYGLGLGGSTAGTAYGVYGKAINANKCIGVYGESEINGGVSGITSITWDWIAGVSGGTPHGGWVSTTVATITDNEKAAIYGKNTGTDYPVGVTGSATGGSSGSGLAGFGSRFGVLGVSTGSGSYRAGGAFHCNNWGSKGAARERSGVGVFSDGGTAGTVSLSPFLGIYSATTIGSKGGAAYFSGNSYVSNGFSLSLIDTSSANNDAARVAAFDQVNLVPKIQTEGIARLEG